MSIYEKLYDWQKKIIDKFKNKLSFGLFLDMGLGKTPISLGFAEQNNCTKVLIISINSKATEDENIHGSWFDWINSMSTKYIKLNKFSEVSQNKKEPTVFLLNYESLFDRTSSKLNDKPIKLKENVTSFLKSCLNNNVALIIDESHKVKNLQSKQTKAIEKIQSYLEKVSNNCYTYLLTGTPFTTGYIDLYSQLKLLGYTCTKGNFMENFCIRGRIPGLLDWQQPIVGYKNIDKLYSLIHEYALTIKSEEVINLPDKVFVEHVSNYSNQFSLFTNEKMKSSKINDELSKRTKCLVTCDNDVKANNPFFRNIAYPDFRWIADTNGTFWLRARQLSIGFQGNEENAEWFDRQRLEQLKTFLEQNEANYILFYNFVPELTELYTICEELGYNIDVYCGSVKSLYFYEKYQNQSDSEKLINNKNIILANFASGSTGMNWQCYSNCIIFSIPLYKDYEQGIKRIHRIGQKNTTIYHIFYQNNWLDNGMKKSLDEAKEYNQKMFDSDLQRINELKEN